MMSDVDSTVAELFRRVLNAHRSQAHESYALPVVEDRVCTAFVQRRGHHSFLMPSSRSFTHACRTVV